MIKKLLLVVLATGAVVVLLVLSNRKLLPGAENINTTRTIRDGKNMKILSTAFLEGQTIPEIYSCKGENINPELVFEEVPINAKSLSLILDDPDAPNGTFTHWVVFNMPPGTESIPEKSNPPGVVAKNGAGQNKYIGPCPPTGTHRYYFKLYALDAILPADAVTNKDDLTSMMHGHIITEAELMGLFAK